MRINVVKIRQLFAAIPATTTHAVMMFLIVIGTATAAYGLGKLARLEEAKMPIEIEETAINGSSSPPVVNNQVVKKQKEVQTAIRASPKASQRPVSTQVLDERKQTQHENATIIGAVKSKKYFFPWCGTVARLKEDNIKVFNSISEAKSAGYSPAKNCKGLE